MVEDTAESGRTKTTTDHDTIRNWVEERGSTAAQIIGLSSDGPEGLAITPETRKNSVGEISWDEFFEIFEDGNLTFVYQTDRDDPPNSGSVSPSTANRNSPKTSSTPRGPE